MIITTAMKTIFAATLLLISIPAALYFWKMPAPKLSATEKDLINFSSPPLTLSSSKTQAIFSGLDYPVRITIKQQASPVGPEGNKQTPAVGAGIKSFPPGPIPAASVPALASKPFKRNSFGSKPVVSMIYSEGDIKTAIIDGQVLHEGSFVGGSQIVTIEKTRVLMRNAGKETWLSID
jgi:hypothetical protein